MKTTSTPLIVRSMVDSIPFVDIHTHLFPTSFKTKALFGIDELLNYHYLTSEFLVKTKTQPERYFGAPHRERAQQIWTHLFVKNTPLSEASSGVVNVISKLGLDPNEKSLDALRAAWPSKEPGALEDLVFRLAQIQSVVMTNNPCDPEEWSLFAHQDWDRSRFQSSLRLDDLFVGSKHANPYSTMKEEGIRSFLGDAIRESNPKYLALSTDASAFCKTVLPSPAWLALLKSAKEHGLPIALMWGVQRGTNAAFLSGGDSIGDNSLEPLIELLRCHPDQTFMVTVLDLALQHQITALARVFPNLILFGCWWYLNNPTIHKNLQSTRMEMLGLNFVPQHSDARILEQLIYKWDHFRNDFSSCLAGRYDRLLESGLTLDEDRMRRDIDHFASGLKGHCQIDGEPHP